MKLLAVAALAAASLSAQMVTVTGTLYSPWSPAVTWSGRVEITANCSMTYAGRSYERGSTLTVVAVNGVFSARLIPNLAASVSGCYNNENVYVVNFNPSSGGQRYTQKWAVPASPATTTPQAVVVPSVINGTGGGVPYSQSFTAATSITITAATHRLGTTPVLVTVYDSTGFETDANVSWNSTNGTVTVSFAIATSGRVVVMAAGGIGGWGGAYIFQSPLENVNNQISLNQSMLSIGWPQVTSKPTFATVATSGSYNDLSGRPTLGTASAQNTSAFEVPLTFGAGLNRSANNVILAEIQGQIEMPGGLDASTWWGMLSAASSATSAATALNTADTIVKRDSSGNFTAGTITAALNGNASTATALASDPTACGAGYVTDIAANGTLTCSAPPSDPLAGIAGLRTLGSGAQQAAAGDDARLSDTRTPTDGSVTTLKLVDGSVTLGKITSIATARLLGNVSGSSAAPAELTAAAVKTFLGIAPADITGSNILTNAAETVTSGATFTPANRTRRVFVDPASALASLTITMPATPQDGDQCLIFFGGTIAGGSTVVTTLSIAANAGQSLLQYTSATSAVSGDLIQYEYSAASTRWYRTY